MATPLRRHAILALILICLAPIVAPAQSLPPVIQAHIKTALAPVGTGTYTKFGFTIYRATLWAPGGVYDPAKPYALELAYARSLSSDTLVDTVIGDIRDQKIADDDAVNSWEKTLDDIMPDVKDGDTIIGRYVPGKPSALFYNGAKIAAIDDPAFSKAFFDIWLGDNADEDLRDALLGHQED
jgi:hypothetical protein